jgi:ATP-binding cassette subfamily B protein
LKKGCSLLKSGYDNHPSVCRGAQRRAAPAIGSSAENRDGNIPMTLRETLPPELASRLGELGVDVHGADIVVSSDLGLDGRYGATWLVIGRDRLVVLEEDAAKSVRWISLEGLEEARAHPMVGNQRLELTIGGQPYELLHYTNAVADKFSGVIKVLNDMAARPDRRSPLLEEGALVVEKTEEEPQLERGKIIRRLFSMARPFWAQCLAMFLLMMVHVALDLTPPLLTKVLVDGFRNEGGGGGISGMLAPAQGANEQWLMLIVGILLAVRLVAIAITVINNRINATVGQRFLYNLRQRVFDRLQQLAVSFYDRKQVGGLVNRVANDTEALGGFVVQIVLLIGIGIAMFAMNWQLALFVLVPGPLVMFASYKFWKLMHHNYERYWFTRWRTNSFLNACLSGIRVVRAFAQEKREMERFQVHNERLTNDVLTINRRWSTFFPIVTFVWGLGSLLVWYFGGLQVLRGENQGGISLGTLMAFIGYLGMFYGPLTNLTQISNWSTQLLTAAHRIFEVLDAEIEVKEPKNPVKLPQIAGKVEFQNVSFGYKRYLPVLHNVSFTVEPGEMIGIVGQSGSGKTTLINLACRFYDPTDGVVKIDGVDLRQISTRDLRSQIGLVLQEPYLFRGSIAENIAYGRPGASREQIIRAAKAANAHDFIVNLPEGYETRVGDRGAGLSGGERQRVSIARAILQDPRILILDEATSNVDSETERLIQAALEVLVKNRTTFVIAHRLSTLQNADKILVLHRGLLKEFGTPAELLSRGGIYARFVTTQAEMFQLHRIAEKIWQAA